MVEAVPLFHSFVLAPSLIAGLSLTAEYAKKRGLEIVGAYSKTVHALKYGIATISQKMKNEPLALLFSEKDLERDACMFKSINENVQIDCDLVKANALLKDLVDRDVYDKVVDLDEHFVDPVNDFLGNKTLVYKQVVFVTMEQVCYNDDELWSGVPLFGCFSYVNPASHRSECCPRFCPEAVFIPCLLYGSNTTMLIGEPSLNYDCCKRQPLGDTGLVVTVCSMLASFFICFPISPLLCLLIAYQRISIRRIYYPRDSDEVRRWEACVGCFCPPCALYQQFEFLSQKKPGQTETPTVAEIPLQVIMH